MNFAYSDPVAADGTCRRTKHQVSVDAVVLYKATQIGLSSILHAITLIINTGLSLVDFILGVPSILLEFRIYKALEHF